MSNYKAEALAYELASILATRTGLPCAVKPTSGLPEVRVGTPEYPDAGGVTIVCQDQRAEEDLGWDALPGFPVPNVQPVYTLGVAKVITESTEALSGVEVKASGTLTIGGGVDAPFTALATITIGNTVLTEGTDFAAGATDATSATAIANAINAHPVLKQLVTAVATLGGGGLDSTVVITSKIAGLGPNNLATTETAGSASWGAATLTGGSGSFSSSNKTPAFTMMKIWAELAKRGVKLELWQTAEGDAPTSANTSYKQAEFNPNEFWPLNGLV